MTADTDRLAQIEARLDAATPGPWYVEPVGDFGAKTANIPDVLRERYGNNALQCGEDFATADLIANAPADLRWLLGELRACRTTLAETFREADEELLDALKAAEQIARLAEESEAGWRRDADEAHAALARVKALADTWAEALTALAPTLMEVGGDVAARAMTLLEASDDVRAALGAES